MRNYPALRLGGQVFCCAAVLSFFEPFCRDARFFWLLAAGILAVALAAVRCSRRPLRLVLALVPALAFLVPVSGWISAAAGAAVGLYALLSLTRGSFSPDFYAYRLEAAWTLAICGLLAVISFFLAPGGVSCFWFPVCAALLVLLALRMLQVGGSMGPAWQAGSAGMLCAVLAAGVVLGLGVWSLRFVLRDFFRILSTGFAYLISLLLFGVAWLGTRLFGNRETDVDPGLPDLVFNTGGNPNPSSQIHTETHYASIDPKIPWTAILTVAAVILLILAAIKLLRARGLRRMRKYQTRQANDTAVAEGRTKRKKLRQGDLDNRGQIRLLYSRYLDYLRRRGVKLEASRTTQEISEASSELLLHTDRLLRSLYRKARYSGETVTDEDLATAEAQFQRLLAEENLRQKPS